MKRIINVLLVAVVLTMVPMSYACTGKTENPKECQVRLRSCGKFSEGLADYRDANWKYGYIDQTGKVVIPCQWKAAWPFHDGLAAVQNANSKFGFIDKTGKVIIPCLWEGVEFFRDGLAEVEDANGNKYLFDKTGKIVE